MFRHCKEDGIVAPDLAPSAANSGCDPVPFNATPYPTDSTCPVFSAAGTTVFQYYFLSPNSTSECLQAKLQATFPSSGEVGEVGATFP